MVFIAFAPSLPKTYPFLSFVPALIFMSFWWFAPIQKKLTAFSSIIWCLIFFNIQILYVGIAPLALSHALIWWYQHHKLDFSRGDLQDLKDNTSMKPIRILWTLADEQSHFPDALNVYFHVFLTVFYFVVGMIFLLDFNSGEMVSGVRLHFIVSGFWKISIVATITPLIFFQILAWSVCFAYGLGCYLLIKWDETIRKFLKLLHEEDMVKERYRRNPDQFKHEFIAIHVKKLSFLFQMQGCDLETAEKLATDVFQPLFEQLLGNLHVGLEAWAEKVKNLKL